jgi:hypothetical protein
MVAALHLVRAAGGGVLVIDDGYEHLLPEPVDRLDPTAQQMARMQRQMLLPIRCHMAWLTAETNRILTRMHPDATEGKP